MKLFGKTALLTGAGGGIGSAIAQALDAEGVKLILTGRDKTKLEHLKQTLKGKNHITLAADLTCKADRDDLKALAAKCGLDLLINNAGLNQLALLDDLSEAQTQAIITMNLTIPMLLCKELLPLLVERREVERRESAIVNVGSILGSIGYAGSTAYCAAKFGLRGFSESLRRELADQPVKVIYFAPRATETALNTQAMRAMNHALGTHVDKPEVVAHQLIKVLTNNRGGNRYLGWPEKFFVRLNGLLPSWVDKALSKQLPIIRHYARAEKQFLTGEIL
jgi:short-subunit dehydrogenase